LSGVHAERLQGCTCHNQAWPQYTSDTLLHPKPFTREEGVMQPVPAPSDFALQQLPPHN
jgi:hypothetical protein